MRQTCHRSSGLARGCWWWAARVSNPRPPACQAGALPTELAARRGNRHRVDAYSNCRDRSDRALWGLSRRRHLEGPTLRRREEGRLASTGAGTSRHSGLPSSLPSSVSASRFRSSPSSSTKTWASLPAASSTYGPPPPAVFRASRWASRAPSGECSETALGGSRCSSGRCWAARSPSA